MFKNHAHHTFEPNIYWITRYLKIVHDSTLLLIMQNGKERKTNINNVKSCSATELVKRCLGFIPRFHKNPTSKLQL